MAEHPIQGLMNVTMDKIRQMADSNTIIGEPITTPDGVTVIPVSRVSFGFGAGGSDFASKHAGPNAPLAFGGGGGAGLKVIPVGFLVVSGTSVKMLPVDTATESPADLLVELIPDLLEQVSKKWEERKAKKQAEPEITEEDLV